MRKFLLILAFLFFVAEIGADRCVGQSWSGILSPSRAIDWSKAGLPTPTLLDGESTPNPWTPPTRTTLCISISPRGGGLDDTSAILTAIGTCSPSTYVSMSGNFTVTSAFRAYGTNISNKNNVTLRGTGPMTTSITLNAAGSPIQFGAFADGGGGNITNLATNPKGQTSFIVANVTGTGSLVANNVAYINQADNGYTCTVPIAQAATCTGSASDTGSIFFCQHDPYCNDSSHTGGGQHHSEEQVLRIVSATNNGNGTWTVVTDPGLYMSDWSASRGATLRWNTSGFTVYGMAIEDMTIRVPDNGGSGDNLQIQSCVGCWVKGLRIIGPNNTAVLLNHNCVHCLVMNNYMFGESNTFVGSALENLYASGEDGDTLILNNIGDGGMFNDDDFDMHQGIVMAYNYARDVDTNHYQSTQFEHEAGSALMLREGNQFGRINDDATWSSHNFNTNFRNNLDCGDYPYQIAGGSGGGIQVSSFARFSNLIGNVIGISVPSSYLTTGTSKCTTYQSQADDGAAYNVNGHTPFDAYFGTTGSTSLTNASLFRWGNVTTNGTTTTTSFNASENPSNLSNYPNATSYANIASPSTSLPCSFFMQSYLPSAIAAATTCTPTTSGHTGLNWWKVCDTWTTFPTSCSHFTTPSFPATGPDVGGFANDIPAAVAWKKLPIDTTFQNSYTITASSWASGTETLTVSGLPALFNFLGGFQLSGVSTNNCFPSGVPAELLMTGSSTTQVMYALTSDPGANACTGTLKWPDIRQFDERVYATDPGGTGALPPNPPTGLSATIH